MGKIDIALLEQWLSDQSFVNWAKQLDDNDIAKWEEYLNGDPEHWELAKSGRLIVQGIPFQGITTDEAQANKSLAALMGELDSDTKTVVVVNKESVSSHKNKDFKMPKHWLVAASVATFMLISGIVYFQFFHNAEMLWVSGYGEATKITLPDGSKAVLGPNSKLACNSKNPRIFHLEGEAFFEVKKKPKTGENFQVVTHDLSVIVLGTIFNVNTRNDRTEVFLEEGKIELVNSTKEEIEEMAPGQVVVYSKKNNEVMLRRKDVPAIEHTSWKSGFKLFQKISLRKVLHYIEDIYGINIEYESDELRKAEFSGGIPIENLDAALEMIKHLTGNQINRVGQRYFVSKKGE